MYLLAFGLVYSSRNPPTAKFFYAWKDLYNTMKALLGRKIGMSQVINDDGVVTRVTLVHAGPCTVTQVKTSEKDGYDALQIAYGNGKNINKPQVGHFKSSKVAPAFVKEIRGIEFDKEATKSGSSFDVDTFEMGDKVHVQGTSKGKGWAGTIKRWNFSRSKKTHGGNGAVRRPGSIGSMYPQKVMKGKKMAGQMGHKTTTIKNLEIAMIDTENHLIGIKGAIPGPKKGLVVVRGAK
jgi:large subunit ribosomal protein L3